MIALITGASSGLGLEVSKILTQKGYDIIGVSRHEGDFSKLKDTYPNRKFEFISLDLSSEEGVKSLIDKTKNIDIDYFFDNAGYGMIGHFDDDNIEKEMKMVDLNVKACHRLLKAFTTKFYKRGKGNILVTASAAAFAPAPYMTPYYSTKVYVYYLALGYWRELKERKSKVILSVLCPGPVATNFEKAGNVKFNIKPISCQKSASYAVKKSLKGKTVIVPSFKIKCLHFFSHFLPKKFITKVIKKSAD